MLLFNSLFENVLLNIWMWAGRPFAELVELDQGPLTCSGGWPIEFWMLWSTHHAPLCSINTAERTMVVCSRDYLEKSVHATCTRRARSQPAWLEVPFVHFCPTLLLHSHRTGGMFGPRLCKCSLCIIQTCNWLCSSWLIYCLECCSQQSRKEM